jgi:hypothetical protein
MKNLPILFGETRSLTHLKTIETEEKKESTKLACMVVSS